MRKLYVLLVLLAYSLHANAQPLKVCTNEWPPYTALVDGQVRGIDADLLHLALTNLGISYEITLEPWRRCLRKMSDGQLDILLDAFYSEDRARHMIFPDEPMAESAMVLFYATARPHRIDSIEDLRGLRVGTEPGYAYGDPSFARATHFVRESAPTLEANFGKLLLGRIDLVITDRAVGLHTANGLGMQAAIDFNPQPLYSDRVYAAFSRKPGTAALLPRFERELKRLKASPEYAEILRRYLQPVTIEQSETRTD